MTKKKDPYLKLQDEHIKLLETHIAMCKHFEDLKQSHSELIKVSHIIQAENRKLMKTIEELKNNNNNSKLLQ